VTYVQTVYFNEKMRKRGLWKKSAFEYCFGFLLITKPLKQEIDKKTIVAERWAQS